MVRIKCDDKNGCNRDFVLELSDLVKTSVVLDGEECKVIYLLCPHCGNKNMIHTENAELRKLIAEEKKLDKKLSRNVVTQKAINKHNELIKQKQELKFLIVGLQRELNKSVYPRL